MDRRSFLSLTLAGAGSLPALLASSGRDAMQAEKPLFQISLAQWSLHRTLRKGALDNLDFAATARRTYGIEAVEYVNQFFKDKAGDRKYLAEMKRRASDAGVRSLLIMVDGEGHLGDPVERKRLQAVEKHKKWLEAARFLGCHSIRVNAYSSGSYEEQMKRAADGLGRLADLAAPLGLNVLVENHGGLSSNARWLAAVMKLTGRKNCGTLPDYGNFRISPKETYDRYLGVKELMPYARAVSAKSHDFDEDGNEIHTDFHRMLKIVVDAGYRGFVGVEYEGGKLSEKDGIIATKRLLERVRKKLQER